MPTHEMVADPDRCYRAVLGRDRRFDGMFFTGVRTTGIYCRPSCPAVTPRRSNVDFFVTAAAAQAAGLRACRRCRPDLTPGSPEWDVKADVAGRAMRMIADGVVDREGVPGLAARSGYTTRHLGRVLTEQLGAGPLALARAQRAHTARILIETTDVALSDVAFAAGFGSLRQFNETVQQTFAATPTALRQRRHGGKVRPRRDTSESSGPKSGPGVITLSLAVREPFAASALLDFLAARAVAGIEEASSARYRRTLRLPLGHGVVELEPAGRGVRCSLELTDMRDLAAAVERCRRLLDLDADPVAIDGVLAGDDLLRGSVEATPGRRVPGHVDGFEVAVRAVVGQQISVSSAATVLGRLVAAHGERVYGHGQLTHAFPTPEALAEADPERLPMPRARGRALVQISRAVSGGHLVLDRSGDRLDVRRRLLQLPGVGPWTAGYISMRALGDPDVFLSTDLGARQALAWLASANPGAEAEFGLVAAATAKSQAERWRPWRSYALMHVWAALETPARQSLVVPSTDTPWLHRPEGASRDRL